MDGAALDAWGGVGAGVLMLAADVELVFELEPKTDSFSVGAGLDEDCVALEALGALEAINPALAAGVGSAVVGLVARRASTGLGAGCETLDCCGLEGCVGAAAAAVGCGGFITD